MKQHKVTQSYKHAYHESSLINLVFRWISLQSKEICHLFSTNTWIYKLLFKKRNHSEGKWIFSFGNLLLLCWILHLCQTHTVIHQSTIKLKRTITTHKDCPLACADNYNTGTTLYRTNHHHNNNSNKTDSFHTGTFRAENECLCSHRSSNECLCSHRSSNECLCSHRSSNEYLTVHIDLQMSVCVHIDLQMSVCVHIDLQMSV